MINKITSALILFLISVPLVHADVFIPETKYNYITKEKYMDRCGLTDEAKTTQYCKIPANSETLKKRIEILNRYADFDLVLRQKMYNEITWDLSYDFVDYEMKGEYNYPGRESAERNLNNYTDTFEGYAYGFLSNIEQYNDENYFRDNIRSQLYVVIGYNLVEIERKNLIKDGLIDNTDSYKVLYLGNIDEIEKIFNESDYYKKLSQKEKDLFDNIYFPNVRRFLELEKQWASFYRNYDNYDEQDFKDFGYSNEEIQKAKSGDYTNTYDTKVDFEYEVDQNVGTNIIAEKEQGIDTTDEDVDIDIKEQTKLEMYAEKWGKDIEKEIIPVETIIVNYFKRYKAKKGITQIKVDNKVKLLKESAITLLDTYEKKYNSTTNIKNKNKYKKIVWILLLLEKVLEENTF